MKKKILACAAAVAALALSAVMLTGCGGSNATGDEFVVGFDSGYPPYGYVGDDGEYTGFDLELAQEVCNRNGWTFKAEPIDWDAKDAMLEQGSITCIWNGFTYEGREDGYAWSDKYMKNGQVVVVKADSDIKTLDDLADKAVLTQVESAGLEILESDYADLNASFAGGAVQTVDTFNTAFMQLESGQVDAVVCDLSIAAFQMSAKPDAYVTLDELSSEHYAVGFAKGNEDMAATVTETLKAMDEDGFVKELCDKYADQGISYENWCL
ncbi:transporter substrate-binding domain-containing protein [Adlercreutzia sp. ZJ138]|uniref:transporter substrate-binding domain-containing protein n=1 Tax=Adlercreutzia sp. ZJ138 TaxID=2709405 RepID=UPI0013ECE33B|nr:transporter substrate-binding domain-containing protein [Adlercreutzia sp. ZJ138]